jgi:hypothetical protein
MLYGTSDDRKHGQGKRSTDAERQQRNPDYSRGRAPHFFG